MFGCFDRFQVFVELGHAALILENQKCEVYQSLLAIESKQNEGSTEAVSYTHLTLPTKA